MKGRDPDAARMASMMRCFNPRAREGARPADRRASGLRKRRFNPRAREGARRSRLPLRSVRQMGFNPRAREGRDARANRRPCGTTVSIHAPVKGRDFVERGAVDRHTRFQSTRP